MPKENNNIVPVLDALNNVSGETGDKKVDKNIIESDARQGGRKSTKKKDPNSGGEKIYFTKIATIFGETFKKINKPKDTAIETDIEGEPESPVEKATQLAMPKMEKKKKGMLAIMAGILLAVGVLAFFLHDKLSPTFRFLSKTIFRIIPILKSLWKIFGGLIRGTQIFRKVTGMFAPILRTVGRVAQAIRKIPGGGGLLKMLAKIGGKVGLKLLKVLKFIPYIGSAINFGFAFFKFKKGDVFGGILELLAGIGGLLPPPFTLIGLILDGITLIRDIAKAKKEKKGEGKKGEAKEGFWSKLGKSVGKFLMKFVENLPVIGGLILWGKAFAAFSKGDNKKGFELLGRGFISFFGFGFLYEGVKMVMGFFGGKKKKEDKDVKEEPGFWSKLGKSVGKFLMKYVENLPVIGGLILWGKAFAAFSKGDHKKGFGLLGRGFISFIGLGFLYEGIKMVMGFFGGKKKKEDKDVKDEGGLGKMVKSIGGWLFKTAENLPVIGGFILFGKAIAAFIGGDIGKGLALFGRGILAFFVGGKGADLIIKGVGALIGFAKNAGKKVNIKFPSFDAIGKIASWITGKVWKFVGGIWDGIWGIIKGIWSALKNTAKWLFEKLVFKPGKIVGELFKFFGKIIKFIFSIPGRLLELLKGMVKKGFELAKKIPVLGGIIGGVQKMFGGGDDKETAPVKKEVAHKKDADKSAPKGPLKIESAQLKYIAALNNAQVSVLQNVRGLLEEINRTLKTSGPPPHRVQTSHFPDPAGSPVGNNSESRPVNNEGVVHDSRSAYNLSPYSINVPA